MNATFTLAFDQISAADLPHVGGKGANLGEMTRAGFPVPPGFCLTTEAFQRFIAASQVGDELYASLEALVPGDIEAVRPVGQQVRRRLSAVLIPSEVEADLIAAWEAQGADHAYAVRSSATAEDLPHVSFAGQQDTYLNIRGHQALLESVRACWISLFTDRAILYRAQNGFAHRQVGLAVVVQHMLWPEVSGILFTADPVSGHRQLVSIDASYGLGEALVSGLVSPDLYKVDKRNETIVETRIADKQLAIRPKPEGGTFRETLPDDLRTAQVLNPDQIRPLADLGTRIERHYGQPQDIEWCLEKEQLYIVQSRPITSLFPLPEPRPTDEALHLYFSLSHAQVMTDPMPPMALSIWRIIFPFGKPDASTTYNPYIDQAAGRLYIDLSPLLALPLGRRLLPGILVNADQLIAQAVRQVIERDEFKRRVAKLHGRATMHSLAHWVLPLILKAQARLWWHRPEGATAYLSDQIEAYISQARAGLAAAAPGAERLKAAQDLLGRIFVEVALPMPPFLIAGMMARGLIARLTAGHGDPQDVAALSRGLLGNVATEMDLAVGDLADIARRSPDLVHHLTGLKAATALETTPQVSGGEAFMAAWRDFLDHYGMRGPSEIDISRPRWRDEPASLLQVVIGNLQHEEAGAHRVYHQRLVAEGEAAGARLVAAARHGPFGFLRAALVRRLVRVARNLLPMREHPKFLLIRAIDLVRQAILEAAGLLHQQGRIDAVTDIWFLELPEAITALDNPAQDLRPRIDQRRADLARFRNLTPPRVITSDGEMPVVEHAAEHLPDGALPGSPVSAGVVEGQARVVLDPTAEVLRPGEILVAPFTDPGWTPLFINAAGLVMEVGGLMTHGSVVAREYGIPAVVGVLNATQAIQTGQRLRLNGDLGYVEILHEETKTHGNSADQK